MAGQRQPHQQQNEWMESPTAWFAVLERAKLTHDHGLAVHAQQELHRLGVSVSFRMQAEVRPELSKPLP